MEFSLFGISSRGREAWKAGWARRDVRDALSFSASTPLLVPSAPVFGDNLGFTPFQQLLLGHGLEPGKQIQWKTHRDDAVDRQRGWGEFPS